MSEAAGGRSVDRRLFIELVFHFVLLRVVLVAFLEVFRQHDVSVFSDGLHPSLPAHTDARIYYKSLFALYGRQYSNTDSTYYVRENFSWVGEFFTGEFAGIMSGWNCMGEMFVGKFSLWGIFRRR